VLSDVESTPAAAVENWRAGQGPDVPKVWVPRVTVTLSVRAFHADEDAYMALEVGKHLKQGVLSDAGF
jgi:hypothetical protein